MLIVIGLASCSKEKMIFGGDDNDVLRNNLSSQVISVVGTVLERGTEEPISGAVAKIIGTPYGSLTDSQGRFVISGDLVGDQLEVSCTGFVTAKYLIPQPPGDLTTVYMTFRLKAEPEEEK